MKRAGNLIYKIADPDNLRLAFWKSTKGKSGKNEVIQFRKNVDSNLLDLRQQIISGNVLVGNYNYFTVYEPKERVICAASFPERVLHHSIMNICHSVFDNYQIFDSYATRIGKGTYAALHRAEYFNKKYDYYLKLDIRKYFDSVDHKILKNLLRNRFKDVFLLEIFDKIIDSYFVKEEKGLPIGNLTSQYFANFYLAFVDRYTKNVLKIKAYVRYMDDMVLWSNNKEELKEVAKKVTLFLFEKLKLNLKYSILNKSNHGLTFVGYRIYKGITKLSKRSKSRFKSKMVLYNKYLKEGFWSQEQYQRHILPLLAFANHASTYELRKRVVSKLELQNCQNQD